jgi:hypothetical protein
MLSIFIIYSNDRKRQLDITVSCLQEMDGYAHCQKILCVDGYCDISVPNFDVICVKRNKDFFNWSSMWNASISISKFDNILYLDSDRILPKNYLTKVVSRLEDDKFIYSKVLVRLNKFYELETVKQVRDNPNKHRNLWDVDFRLPHPPSLAVLSLGKNPMSGNTAFTKATWVKTGGIDAGFEGWGFPDTEYYLRTWKMGMKFETIDCVELHLHHGYAVDTKILQLMNLWNAYKLADNLNMELDENMKTRMKKYNLDITIMARFKSMSNFLGFTNGDIMVL